MRCSRATPGPLAVWLPRVKSLIWTQDYRYLAEPHVPRGTDCSLSPYNPEGRIEIVVDRMQMLRALVDTSQLDDEAIANDAVAK